MSNLQTFDETEQPFDQAVGRGADSLPQKQDAAIQAALQLVLEAGKLLGLDSL